MSLRINASSSSHHIPPLSLSLSLSLFLPLSSQYLTGVCKRPLPGGRSLSAGLPVLPADWSRGRLSAPLLPVHWPERGKAYVARALIRRAAGLPLEKGEGGQGYRGIGVLEEGGVRGGEKPLVKQSESVVQL